jgi:light-regulated signal transduction histidine kinase (bacteriophytochrome)
MVSSYVELLADEYEDELDEETDDYVRYAVAGTERMQAMIDALLEYSWVSTDAGDFTEIDSESVLEDIRRDLKVLVADRDAAVTSGDLPTIVVDENQFGQFIQNLVRNGIEHGDSEAEPPRVHVDAEADDERIVFRVADDGPGIPPDEQD